MKKTKKLWLPISMMVLSFVSCANDYEFLEEDGIYWERELMNWLDDYSVVLEKSGVKLTRYDELKHFTVDSTTFLCPSAVAFPSYYDNPDCFDPVSFRFLLNDTIKAHVPTNIIRDAVQRVVLNQEDYFFVKLTWNCDEQFDFYTVCAFDKENGRLVYDNMLSNILHKDNKKKIRLTRSENIVLEEESTYWTNNHVTSYQGNSAIPSTLTLKIKVKGHWNRIVLWDNDQPIGYRFEWKYEDFIMNNSSVVPAIYSSGVSYYCRPVSHNCSNGHIRYSYVIWVGPSSYYSEAESFYGVLEENKEYVSTEHGTLKAADIHCVMNREDEMY